MSASACTRCMPGCHDHSYCLTDNTTIGTVALMGAGLLGLVRKQGGDWDWGATHPGPCLLYQIIGQRSYQKSHCTYRRIVLLACPLCTKLIMSLESYCRCTQTTKLVNIGKRKVVRCVRVRVCTRVRVHMQLYVVYTLVVELFVVRSSSSVRSHRRRHLQLPQSTRRRSRGYTRTALQMFTDILDSSVM